MFCKNCGATISASDEKCARCGFQAPALSDCGGFYDLAPHAPKAAAPVMPKEPAPAPEAPRREVPAPARTSTLWIAVLGGLMLLILALQVLVLVKLADHENRIHNVSSEVEGIRNLLTDDQTPTDGLETTVPSGTDNPNDPADPTDQPDQPSTTESISATTLATSDPTLVPEDSTQAPSSTPNDEPEVTTESAMIPSESSIETTEPSTEPTEPSTDPTNPSENKPWTISIRKPMMGANKDESVVTSDTYEGTKPEAGAWIASAENQRIIRYHVDSDSNIGVYYTYDSREDDEKHLLVTVQINGEQLAQQVSCSEYLVTYNQNGWSGDLDIRGSWVPADDNPMFIDADITLTNEQVEDLSEGKDVRLTIKLMLDEVNELNITLTGEPEDFILNS